MSAPNPPKPLSLARERTPAPASSEEGTEYIRAWHERESFGTDPVDAFVLILKTSGCYWARVRGCTMCGYAKETLGRAASREEIEAQVSRALRAYRDEPYVKIFTSGSFLDPSEVPVDARKAVAEAFRGRAQRLLFESLPEFLTEESVGGMRDAFGGEIEVAVGLETTQDEVLRRSVDKVSTVAEYLESAARVRRAGGLTKAYLLLKPPYLSEREAVEDAVTSIQRSAPYFSTISVNPVHIQNGTMVEHLWHRGLYRPPWLWSLVETMVRGKQALPEGVRLVSFPTSGGNRRGVHNCLSCDPGILKEIERASLTQDFTHLADLPECGCREQWKWNEGLEALVP